MIMEMLRGKVNANVHHLSGQRGWRSAVARSAIRCIGVLACISLASAHQTRDYEHARSHAHTAHHLWIRTRTA